MSAFSWLTTLAILAAQSPQVIQKADGDHPVNINIPGNGNKVSVTHKTIIKRTTIVYNGIPFDVKDSYLKILVDSAVRQKTADYSFDLARRNKLIKSLSDSLQMKNSKLTEKEEKIRELVLEKIEATQILQEKIDAMSSLQPRPAEKAQEALNRADFQATEFLLMNSERIENDDFTAKGPTYSQYYNGSGGEGGFGIGIRLTGLSDPIWVTKQAGLILDGSTDMIIGKAMNQGETSFLFSHTTEVGPRLRIGEPFSVLMSLSYALSPIIFKGGGKYRCSIVGFAGSLGFRLYHANINFIYRVQYLNMFYHNEPKQSMLGVSLSWM
jgi:hypothetical protein